MPSDAQEEWHNRDGDFACRNLPVSCIVQTFIQGNFPSRPFSISANRTHPSLVCSARQTYQKLASIMPPAIGASLEGVRLSPLSAGLVTI